MKKKSYYDYLKLREEQAKKGIALKPVMSETAFNEYYTRIRAARRAGEIKGSAWRELYYRERLIISYPQAKLLANTARLLYNNSKIRPMDVYKYSKKQIEDIYLYLSYNHDVVRRMTYE